MEDLEDPGRSAQVLNGEFLGPKQDQSRFLVMTE